MPKLKIRKIGKSAGVILPKELLAHLGGQLGGSVMVTKTLRGIELHPSHTVEGQMAVARRVMAKNRRALAELAKH